MAIWDSADLLARCKFHANRPTTDEAMTDAQWYTLLSDAQQRWTRIIASLVPESGVTEPVQLSETTPGKVWTFADVPLGHLELRHGREGELLTVGADFAETTDLVWEGDRVRVPGGRSQTYANGIYARYIATPTVIDGSTAPTLRPAPARLLLVYDAVMQWAERGGHRDPSPYRAKLQAVWGGDPMIPGDTGILGSLRTTVFGQGIDASTGLFTKWWQSQDFA